MADAVPGMAPAALSVPSIAAPALTCMEAEGWNQN
jgi:hypothetical protein